jgi:hypothetical protein
LKSELVKVLESTKIVIGLLDVPTVCEMLTWYVPAPPDPVPNAVIKVPAGLVIEGGAIPVPVSTSYTARGGGVPSPTEHDVIVSVVFAMNPVQLSTWLPVDASVTLSVE